MIVQFRIEAYKKQNKNTSIYKEKYANYVRVPGPLNIWIS